MVRKSFVFYILFVLFVYGSFVSCIKLNVGSEGQPCNSKQVCKPGLVCVDGTCKRPIPSLDGDDDFWADSEPEQEMTDTDSQSDLDDRDSKPELIEEDGYTEEEEIVWIDGDFVEEEFEAPDVFSDSEDDSAEPVCACVEHNQCCDGCNIIDAPCCSAGAPITNICCDQGYPVELECCDNGKTPNPLLQLQGSQYYDVMAVCDNQNFIAIASGDGTVELYNYSGNFVNSLNFPGEGKIVSMNFSGDCNFLAFGTVEGRLGIFNVADRTGNDVSIPVYTSTEVAFVRFIAGTYYGVATVTQNGKIGIWIKDNDRMAWDKRSEIDFEGTAKAFDISQSFVALIRAVDNNGSLSIWNRGSKELIFSTDLLDGIDGEVKFRDTNHLVVATNSGFVRIWEIHPDTAILTETIDLHDFAGVRPFVDVARNTALNTSYLLVSFAPQAVKIYDALLYTDVVPGSYYSVNDEVPNGTPFGAFFIGDGSYVLIPYLHDAVYKWCGDSSIFAQKRYGYE